MANVKNTKKKLSPEEKLFNRNKAMFKKKIKNIFVGAGFTHVPTNDHEMTIGFRKLEVDSLFIYENIWLLCEDTIKKQDDRDHIRTKNEAFGIIKSNLADYIDKLSTILPDHAGLLKRYDTDRIQVFGLYISKEELDLADDDDKLFPNLVFVQPKILDYFQWVVQCIKLSARNEIFRFLGITNDQVGLIRSSSSNTEISAPIIYPKSITGLDNRVRIVSFMMSAEDLLDMCYVLRKDNWEDPSGLYQRLIDKKKIKEIREYLFEKGAAFYNNIIVGLPDNVYFMDGSKRMKSIDEMVNFEGNCKLIIPKEMNSICVIDGQHRIYAYYVDGSSTKQEKKIADLRKKLHLLVTGLVFPEDMKPEERIRVQSEIFLDINDNAKPVSPNVLLHIKRLSNPIADESIAQLVIEMLNKDGVFKNMLQLSTLDDGKIKTASIVRFALRYLVTVSPTEGRSSLIQFWDGDKDALLRCEKTAVTEYVKYCSSTLRTYFAALRNNLKTEWSDPTSKLLSVISLNGFIIALNRQLRINGVKDFAFYDNAFKKLNVDFSTSGFPYTSSQYRKFSSEILEKAFGFTGEQIEKS